MCFVMLAYLCELYTFIYSACKTTRLDPGFTAVVNFTGELLQHIRVINILMVTSFRRRRGRERRLEVHTSSAYETKSK